MENRGRSSDVLQDRQLELFRKVLQEEHGSRTHSSVADEVGRLDNSLREAFSQQFSTVLKEITNRDDTSREIEVKLEIQRQTLRQEADAQLRKQAAESEAAAKASVEAVQAESTAEVTECERKAARERENFTQVPEHALSIQFWLSRLSNIVMLPMHRVYLLPEALKLQSVPPRAPVPVKQH